MKKILLLAVTFLFLISCEKWDLLQKTPPAPVARPATNITQTGFSANWSKVKYATDYFLDVATDAGFTNFVSGYKNFNLGYVAAYSVTGLCNTTYYYRVRAGNSAKMSDNSNTITVITTIPVSLLPPAANAASNITQTSFSANWQQSTGATFYYLDVSTSSTFSSFVTGYNNANVGNVLTYNVTGLDCNTTTYYYRARTGNNCETGPNSNTITVTTGGIGTPATPVANAGTNITLTSFSANWTASAGAAFYYLDVATRSATVSCANTIIISCSTS